MFTSFFHYSSTYILRLTNPKTPSFPFSLKLHSQATMASPSNIIPSRCFFPSAMAKQGVDLTKELKGVGWYEYVKRENEWHTELIIEF